MNSLKVTNNIQISNVVKDSQEYLCPIIKGRIGRILKGDKTGQLYKLMNTIQNNYGIQVINVDNISELPEGGFGGRIKISPNIWIPFKNNELFGIIGDNLVKMDKAKENEEKTKIINIIDCKDIQFDYEGKMYGAVKLEPKGEFFLLYGDRIMEDKRVINVRDVVLLEDGFVCGVAELIDGKNVPFSTLRNGEKIILDLDSLGGVINSAKPERQNEDSVIFKITTSDGKIQDLPYSYISGEHDYIIED